MTKDEALRMALEALEQLKGELYEEVYVNGLTGVLDKPIAAIKEALAQPEQEPEAWYHPENDRTYFTAYPDKNMIKNGYWQPLYKKGKL